MLFWHLVFIYFVYNLGLFGLLLFFLYLLNYYYYIYLDSIVVNAYINEDIDIPDQNMDADTHIDDLYYIVCLKTNRKSIAAVYYTNKYIQLKLEPTYNFLEKYNVIKTYNFLDRYYKKPYNIIKNKIIIWYIGRTIKANFAKFKTI